MHRTLRVASLAATLMATLAMPLAAHAAVPFTFDLAIGDSCIQGTGPASSTIELTLMDANNNVIDTDTVQSDSSGDWWQSNCFWYDVHGSDKIMAESGPDSRTLQIPVITTVINRVTDVVSGRGPANSTIDLMTRICHTYNCPSGPSATVNVASNGTYSKDYTSLANLKGRDTVQAQWISPSNDHIRGISRATPFLLIVLGDNRVRGDGKPNSHLTVKLKTAGGTLLSTAEDFLSARSTSINADFMNSSDQPVYPRPGNKVTADFASDASFTLPSITLTHDADSVSGHCSANSWVYVYVENGAPSYDWTEGYATSNSNGNFSIALADMSQPTFVIGANDRWEVDCQNKKGDMVALYSHFN
jgi:hypothetical protein